VRSRRGTGPAFSRRQLWTSAGQHLASQRWPATDRSRPAGRLPRRPSAALRREAQRPRNTLDLTSQGKLPPMHCGSPPAVPPPVLSHASYASPPAAAGLACPRAPSRSAHARRRSRRTRASRSADRAVSGGFQRLRVASAIPRQVAAIPRSSAKNGLVEPKCGAGPDWQFSGRSDFETAAKRLYRAINRLLAPRLAPVVERRGGDSNSRYANQTHNAFRERRIQPLCHPSLPGTAGLNVDHPGCRRGCLRAAS
jgi:hypothetical protein